MPWPSTERRSKTCGEQVQDTPECVVGLVDRRVAGGRVVRVAGPAAGQLLGAARVVDHAVAAVVGGQRCRGRGRGLAPRAQLLVDREGAPAVGDSRRSGSLSVIAAQQVRAGRRCSGPAAGLDEQRLRWASWHYMTAGSDSAGGSLIARGDGPARGRARGPAVAAVGTWTRSWMLDLRPQRVKSVTGHRDACQACPDVLRPASSSSSTDSPSVARACRVVAEEGVAPGS